MACNGGSETLPLQTRREKFGLRGSGSGLAFARGKGFQNGVQDSIHELH
jgi:hypothetical protein